MISAFIKLASGNALSQIISLLAFPFLAAIYGVEAFGEYGLFFALSQIFGSLITLRYELAIMLPVNQRGPEDVLKLSLFVSLIFVFLAYLLIPLCGTFYPLEKWMYFIPITSLGIAAGNATPLFLLKKGKLNSIIVVAIVRGLILILAQLLLVSKYQINGLILGHFISSTVALTMYLSLVKFIFSKREILLMAFYFKRYKRFPMVSLWGLFLNLMSSHGISVIMKSKMSFQYLGIWTTTIKYFGSPISVFGNSISNLYMKELSENSDKVKIFTKYFLLSIGASLTIYAIVYFSLPIIFDLLFDDDWIMIVTVFNALLPYFVLRFIHSSLSMSLIVIEKQHIALLLQLFIFALSLGSIFIFGLESIDSFARGYSLILTLGYSINIVIFRSQLVRFERC